MNVTVVMGEPGTGKTTLMRQFMSESASDWQLQTDADFPLVPHHYSRDLNCVILGKYEDGETFAGTDRMSMAVQPQAVAFMNSLKGSEIKNVVFEGDRLTNQSFLEFLLNDFGASIIYLDVPEEERQRRYAERGSNQSEQFLRGRVTKYANLRTNFDIMMAMETHAHVTPADTAAIVSLIQKKLV